MKIEKIQPNVITYALYPSQNDEEYGECMWAKFIFDCDNGQLNINSDAGDYSYRWGYNENEDFMNLMMRINKDYLLNKVSNRLFFDEDASKKETIKLVKRFGLSCFEIKNGKQISDIVNKIKAIEYGCSEEYFIRKVKSIIPTIDYENIEVIKEFPRGAVIITDLFERYIQPKIKEELIQKMQNAPSIEENIEEER